MLSIRLYMNSATNSGKHCTRRFTTRLTFTRRDFGVSSFASGNVNTTNVAAATAAITMLDTPTFRVMSRANVNPISAAAERKACDMPARYSLSFCCRRPSYTSASASTIL